MNDRINTSKPTSAYADFERGEFFGQPDPYLNETHNFRGHLLPDALDNESHWLGLPSDELREVTAARFESGINKGVVGNYVARRGVVSAGRGVIRRAKERALAKRQAEAQEAELRSEILGRARRRVR